MAVVPPDPTHPTDGPQPSDKPNNNTMVWLAVAAAGAGAAVEPVSAGLAVVLPKRPPVAGAVEANF